MTTTMTMTPAGTPIFHADHGLTVAHYNLIDDLMSVREGFFIEAIPLGPQDLTGTLQSVLYGPSCGDDPITEDQVEYVKRGNRPGPSRLIDRPTRPADHMVVIGIAGDDPKVFTAYGNIGEVVAPREPWDSTMTPEEAEEAAAFWREHALARGPVWVVAPASPEVIAALIGGAVPVGWESVGGLYTTRSEAGPEAREVIEQGIDLALAAREAGVQSKGDNRDVHPFSMEPKFALSKSLQEQGWQQWHAAVQTRSKEACAAEGVKYKRFRYAVHVWISPEGETCLAKVKLQGKVPLDA